MGLFVCAGKWKMTTKCSAAPTPSPSTQSNSRDAETQGVVLVKTVLEMEPGRPHTSSNQRVNGTELGTHPQATNSNTQPRTQGESRTTCTGSDPCTLPWTTQLNTRDDQLSLADSPKNGEIPNILSNLPTAKIVKMWAPPFGQGRVQELSLYTPKRWGSGGRSSAAT